MKHIITSIFLTLTPSVAYAASSQGDPTVGLVLIIVLLALYFVPSIVACSRNHHQEDAIIVLNIFLGWTVFGWIVALIWAWTEIHHQKEA